LKSQAFIENSVIKWR